MTLSNIADGIVVTDEQDDRGVAVVDDTDAALAADLDRYADDLPCSPAQAAAAAEAYRGGGSLEAAARAADLAPVRARAALCLLGVQSVAPEPELRRQIRAFVDGEASLDAVERRTEAEEASLALAAYVESHDATVEVATVLETDDGGHLARRQFDALADATGDPDALR